MTIDNRFEIGQEVWLRLDKNQSKRIVTGIIVRPGHLLYELSSEGYSDKKYYEMELSAEEDVLQKINNYSTRD